MAGVNRPWDPDVYTVRCDCVTIKAAKEIADGFMPAEDWEMEQKYRTHLSVFNDECLEFNPRSKGAEATATVVVVY